MADRKVKVFWSDEAKADLRFIYLNILEKTKSRVNASNVRTDIINQSKDIDYVHQYEVEEYLGEPYRRMVVRHFKIIYRPVGDNVIRVLQIFDTYQNPSRMRE